MGQDKTVAIITTIVLGSNNCFQSYFSERYPKHVADESTVFEKCPCKSWVYGNPSHKDIEIADSVFTDSN